MGARGAGTFGVLLLASFAAATSAHAQALLRGHVLDDVTEAAVTDAEVELLDSRGRRISSTLANRSGRFSFSILHAGRYRLRVSRLGYQGVTTPELVLAGADTLEVAIRLSVSAILLAPLEVITRSAPRHVHPGLTDFYRRQDLSIGGTFLGPDRLEARTATHVSDYLREVPGVQISGAPGRGGYLVMKRSGCAPAIWIDGALVYRPSGGIYGVDEGEGMEPTALEVLTMISPNDVEAIEVYTGSSQIPAEFGGSTGGCGVISLWTKRGR